MILPYVYKLTHRETGEFYIGYRAINKVKSEFDLGFKYFSSSKKVKQLGFENFNLEIIAEFFDENDAYIFEQELIKENFKKELCLNLHYEKDGKKNFKSIKREKSLSTRAKISKGNKGKKRSQESKKNYSKAKSGINHHFYGKKLSEEHKNKIKNAFNGRPHPNIGRKLTDDQKINLSVKRTGIKLTQEVKDRINIKYSKFGTQNPFYGRKHTEDSLYRMKQKLRIFSPSEELIIFSKYKSGQTRKQIQYFYRDRIKSKKSIDKIINRFSTLCNI